jgi:Ca2+-binding RTX toxin-like protein
MSNFHPELPIQWIQQLGTERDDSNSDITVDTNGNVYISGVTQRGIYGDLPPYMVGNWIAKYDTNGNQQWWQQVYEQNDSTLYTDRKPLIDTDAAGNVYFANRDYYLIDVFKFNSDGELIGSHGVDGYGTRLTSLSVDPLGNVYLSGGYGYHYIPGSPYYGQSWISKFNTTDATPEWQEVVDTYNIAVDANSNIYLVDGYGSSVSKINFDNPSNGGWSSAIGTVYNTFIKDVTFDENGNVYVVGNTVENLAGTHQGNGDIFVAKFDAQGNQKWIKQLGTEAQDVASEIAFDNVNGSVYITGSTLGNLGGNNSGGQDAWIATFDSEGNDQVIWQFGGTGDENDTNIDISSNISNGNVNVIVSGTTTSSLGGTNQGGTDAWVAELNPVRRGTEENDTLQGTAFKDTIFGRGGNDNIKGLAGDDYLNGGGGNDTLDGGTGNDTLIGGEGDDTYIVDSTGDVITEESNAGNDSVISSIDWTLGNNLENLTLSGTNHINGTGNSLNNRLTGNAGDNILRGLEGNDILDGGLGGDELIGGEGDDTYIIDNALDLITEDPNAGIDSVQSYINFTLGDNLENLRLRGTEAVSGTGNSLDNKLIGNDLANVLIGNIGNDTLDGGIGNDTLIGGADNDTYIVDRIGDIIVEELNEGDDTVQAAVSWTLGDNLEDLILTGSSAINGTGNALRNNITGNSANNNLFGEDGDDTLIGGAGNDILIGGVGTDLLTGGTGSDKFVFASLSEGVDTITDFSFTDDVLVVQTLFTSLNYTGTNPIADGYIRGVQSGSNTLIQIDIDGAGSSAGFSTLVTLNNFDASNFSQNNLIF